MTERWLDVPGFNGRYRVGDKGQVQSFVQNPKGRFLRPAPSTKFGHLTLYLGRGNCRLVHRLVLLAFVGPCPYGMEVRHLDGNARNNVLENLKYGTRSENNRDITRHGRRKLSATAVLDIKKRIAGGGVLTHIAKDHDVHLSTVFAIKTGRLYA